MSEKLKTISNEIIRRYEFGYDPSECGIPDGEELPIKEWVEKYRKVLKSEYTIIWVLCRNEYMSEKDIRLFAVWCAREALKLDKKQNQRSIEACNVAERYANGEASDDEFKFAELAAMAARTAAWEAALAAREAAFSEAITAQVDHILTYFEQ